MQSVPARPPRDAFRTMSWSRFLKARFITGVAAHVIMDVALTFCRIGGDFSMRYHEVECIRQSVDPFAVWNGDIVFPPYYGHNHEPGPGQNKMVLAYPPWEYTLLAPFSCFPLTTASRLFSLLEIASILFLAGFGGFSRSRFSAGPGASGAGHAGV